MLTFLTRQLGTVLCMFGVVALAACDEEPDLPDVMVPSVRRFERSHLSSTTTRLRISSAFLGTVKTGLILIRLPSHSPR